MNLFERRPATRILAVVGFVLTNWYSLNWDWPMEVVLCLYHSYNNAFTYSNFSNFVVKSFFFAQYLWTWNIHGFKISVVVIPSNRPSKNSIVALQYWKMLLVIYVSAVDLKIYFVLFTHRPSSTHVKLSHNSECSYDYKCCWIWLTLIWIWKCIHLSFILTLHAAHGTI